MSTPQVLAQPPGACCLRGTIHDGEAKGRIEKILDVDTYIAGPTSSADDDGSNGKIVLFFPDVFGHWINNHLLVDAFGAAGYLSLSVDYFRGDPIQKHKKNLADPNDNPDFDFAGWLKEKQEFSHPFVPKWVEEVKAKYGKADTKYFCVGYCYGAPYVCDQLSDKGICSAGAFAHPAFLNEAHFEALTKPLFLSCSEIDNTFPKDLRRKAVDIMDDKKKVYNVQLFQGVSHGFALRGDMSDPWQKYCKEMSFQGIEEWFTWWGAHE